MRRALVLLLIAALSSVLLLAQPQTAGNDSQRRDTTKAEQPNATPATDKIDINSASKEELMSLKGVGDVYAEKIIENRPYRSKSDLLRKKIIPASTYSEIREQIIAHQTEEMKTKGNSQEK
jgi:competence protein ComEA